jgi:alditol oxidase
MKKREFLKLISAMVAGPVVSPVVAPLLAGAAEDKLKNWAGNLEYGTENLYAANSVQQVQEFVKREKKLKVLGSRHCFNNIADSRYNFLSLKPMDQIEAVEAVHTVTLDGGMTYGQLCPALESKGLALHNLASLPHISVAGACSTATHGSGDKNGNLATAVAALEFVTATGDVVKVSREKDPQIFPGTVVGLGALGVITKVTLNIQPTFTMRQYLYEDLAMAQVKEHFDAIMSSAYSVSLFTDWQKGLFSEVWLKKREVPGQASAAGTDFYGAKPATKNLHPIIELSAENCTEQLGVPGPWYERLPHFRIGFTPSAGKELQSEYFVPRQNAVDAILAVERLRDQITPHLMISEIRSIAGDDLWMSPCYKQACVTLHFTWKQDWPAVSKVLPMIEKEIAAFQPRPHWGKLFTMSPTAVRSRYEKLPEFIALAKQYDPQGKFRNDFLNQNIFG